MWIEAPAKVLTGDSVPLILKVKNIGSDLVRLHLEKLELSTRDDPDDRDHTRFKWYYYRHEHSTT